MQAANEVKMIIKTLKNILSDLKKAYDRPWKIVIISLLFIIAITQTIYQTYHDHKLKTCKKKLAGCFVYDSDYSEYRAVGLWIDYTYKINGVKYKKSYNLGISYYKHLKDLLKNKHFTVVYCEDNPGISYPLILPEQYKESKIMFPDSLKWIEEYKMK